MSQWEYTTIQLTVKRYEYTVTFTSGRKISGLKAILEEWDARGWEFVELVPEPWRPSFPFRIHYVAIFRRPRAAPEQQWDRPSGPFNISE